MSTREGSSLRALLPFTHVLSWIGYTTLCIQGVVWFSLWYLHFREQARLEDPRYTITEVVQTGPQRMALPTLFLAEQMELSVDQPISFDHFDVELARQQLESHPVIETAQVSKTPPNRVVVDYTVPKPIAQVYDMENVAVAHSGALFPIAPFFSPKVLPNIYLGLSNISGEEIESAIQHRLELGQEMLSFITSLPKEVVGDVVWLDLSKAFVPSYGSREVVVELLIEQERNGIIEKQPRLLRLTPDLYQEALGRYLALSDYLEQQYDPEELGTVPSFVIDLRLEHLAYVNHY